MEPEEAARALEQLVELQKRYVAIFIDAGLYRALRLSVTKYMPSGRTIVRGGRLVGHPEDPPNPAPGPLKKRSGNLARALFVQRFKWNGNEGSGALVINDGAAPYGKVHEFGGIKTKTPKRPFARPALEEERPRIIEEIQPALDQVASNLRLL